MATAREVKAGAAYVELFVKNSRLVKGLQDAERRLQLTGRAVTTFGKLIAASGAALQAPLAAAVGLFAQSGTELERMSQRLSASVESLSALGYAAKQTGSDLSAIDSAVQSMNSVIAAARRFDSGALQALGRLQLSLSDIQGLNADQAFEIIADQISRVAEPTEQAARAVAIFGGAGQQLLPMLKNGAGGLRAMRSEAEALGIVMSRDDAEAAAKLTKVFGQVTASARGMMLAIGQALTPTVADAAETIRNLSATISRWVRDNRELAVAIAKVAAVVTVVGGGILALGTAITGAATAFGGLATAATVAASVIGGVWGVIVSPAVLAIGAIGTLTALVAKLTGNWGQLQAKGSQALDALRNGLKPISERLKAIGADFGKVWNGIVAALRAGDIEAAFDIVKKAAALAFAEIKLKGNNVWQDIENAIRTNLTAPWLAVEKAAITALKNIEAAGQVSIANLQNWFDKLRNFGTDAWDSLKLAGIDATKWTAKQLRSITPEQTPEQRAAIARAPEGTGGAKALGDFLKAFASELSQVEKDTIGRMASRMDDAENNQKRIQGELAAALNKIDEDEQRMLERSKKRTQAAQNFGMGANQGAQLAADVDRARADMEAAIAAAQKKAAERRGAVPLGQQAGGEPIFSQMLRSSVGTFSAAAAQALGASSPLAKLERIGEKQLEQQRRQVEKIDQQIQRIGKLEAALRVA